jgi:hypothetical protein
MAVDSSLRSPSFFRVPLKELRQICSSRYYELSFCLQTIPTFDMRVGLCRIPFAASMLKKVVAVCDANPYTYIVSYSVLMVTLAWTAIWIFGFSGAAYHSLHALIMGAWVLSLLWTMQVMRNIVRVSVAGTVSMFYYQQTNMPPRATSLALLRACTQSLGSICFGSLFVPLVEGPCHTVSRIYLELF